MSDAFWRKYKDPRWQRVRLQKMEQADFKCEYCDSAEQTLHVHHKIYRRGKDPWEYEMHELSCLCEDCHEAQHAIKDQLNDAIAQLDFERFHELLGYAQALALQLSCEGSVRVHTDIHARGIAAAFTWLHVGDILHNLDERQAISLEKLWELNKLSRINIMGAAN